MSRWWSAQRTPLDSEAGTRVPAVGVGAEADGELLADVAVGEGDDVVGVAIDADEAGDLDGDAGFLLDLAHGG